MRKEGKDCLFFESVLFFEAKLEEKVREGLKDLHFCQTYENK
jgi:hypothetical protein